MRTIRGFFEFPIIVGLIALAVVLFHICTTEASHDCPIIISTQEACSIYVSDHEFVGADRVEITVTGDYDAWRVNLDRGDPMLPLFAHSADGADGRIWITPRDGTGGCHIASRQDDPAWPHCKTPADWNGVTPINWAQEASNFIATWTRGNDWVGTRTYFICDNHDCGEPEPTKRVIPTDDACPYGQCHRDQTETTQPTQTTQPAPVTTPTVKVNETAPKPTVTYTEVPNPDYAALLKKLEQLKFDIAALEADIASTPRTISVRVDQVVDEPASTVESEPEEVHLWVWTESDLDTSYDPPKITPERIQAWRNSGSTEQCFDQSYLQHFDKKYSVHQHPCKD